MRGMYGVRFHKGIQLLEYHLLDFVGTFVKKSVTAYAHFWIVLCFLDLFFHVETQTNHFIVKSENMVVLVLSFVFLQACFAHSFCISI